MTRKQLHRDRNYLAELWKQCKSLHKCRLPRGAMLLQFKKEKLIGKKMYELLLGSSRKSSQVVSLPVLPLPTTTLRHFRVHFKDKLLKRKDMRRNQQRKCNRPVDNIPATGVIGLGLHVPCMRCTKNYNNHAQSC